MTFRGNTVGTVALLLGWLASSQVLAQDQVAYDLVQDTTVRVMAVAVAAATMSISEPLKKMSSLILLATFNLRSDMLASCSLNSSFWRSVVSVK